jgi:hypothetical protein
VVISNVDVRVLLEGRALNGVKSRELERVGVNEMSSQNGAVTTEV